MFKHTKLYAVIGIILLAVLSLALFVPPMGSAAVDFRIYENELPAPFVEELENEFGERNIFGPYFGDHTAGCGDEPKCWSGSILSIKNMSHSFLVLYKFNRLVNKYNLNAETEYMVRL